MLLASCRSLFVALALLMSMATGAVQAQGAPRFRVIAFYTGRNDLAHVSFVHEANSWFARMAGEYGFQYDSTDQWDHLNKEFLSHYQVVLFLDTRPEEAAQRASFRTYMEEGGAWMGFHFSAFALTPSAYPQNWSWYHDTFLGSGEYGSNTWWPTSAVLRVEDSGTAVTAGVPHLFPSAPNEWYRWKNDLRTNPAIRILLAIDSSSFPLGTGPKPHEIWHSGYYPAVWTNRHYRMVYFNMGHNDMDYEGGTNRTLSHTFTNTIQNRLIINALLWLGTQGTKPTGKKQAGRR